MQKARSQVTEIPLLPLVGTRFQDLFHSPPGVLFTFPSRYWFTIGHGRVCSLGGWSPQIPAVLRYQCHSAGWCFVYRTLTLSRGAFQPTSTTLPATAGKPRTGPTTPESMPPGLGLSRFARRYSGN